MTSFDLAPFLQIGFYLFAILYAIFSAVLFYHWQNFSMSRLVTTQTYIAYGVTSVPLLLIMGVIAFAG
ncbi:MAG: hypothetical protein RLZZ70_309 [Candidatus Parcubacteria bacterium]|jgi:hypothetical protein